MKPVQKILPQKDTVIVRFSDFPRATWDAVRAAAKKRGMYVGRYVEQVLAKQVERPERES